jgi:uncharacterized protein (DUF2141 family)
MVIPLLALLLAVSAQPPSSTLEIDLDGLRNAKGVVHACLTANRKTFPDCKSDPHAIRADVAANTRQLRFAALPPGDYALALFHDENRNEKLDTFMGIPREGFGFSRNPAVRFGPPKYDKVNIQLGPGFTRLRVRLQYML